MSSQAAGSRPASAAAAPSEADGAAAGRGRFLGLWRRTPVRVGTLTAAAALIYCLDSLILFRRFLASTFDLVIFDQGIRGYAHFGAPVSIARGVSDGIGTHFTLLADHWSPALALLVPLYWIHDDPTTLLVAQGVLFALAIPPLWLYTRRQLGPGAAYFVCAAYALSLPVMEAVIFDFHEVAFVPVLTAVMVERFDAALPRGERSPPDPPCSRGSCPPPRSPRAPLVGGIAAAVALLLVKEDMGLLVAGFGCYLLLKRRRPEAWIGLAFVVGGVAATWVATQVLIPAFGGSATFYFAYGQFGATLGSAVGNMLTHPLHALHVFVTPWVKARTMIGLLAEFGFLPLASPMVIAVLPLLAERMLASGYPLWWQAKFQYDAFVVMMLCCAAVDGAARLQRHWRPGWNRLLTYPWSRPAWLRRDASPWRPATLWAAGICAAALVYMPSSPFGSLLHPGFYGVNARVRAAAAAVAHVPSGVEVEASNNLGPRLSGRDIVLLLDGTPRWAPWVVGDTLGLDFPFCSPSQQAQELAYLESHGYTLVFADHGYVVLHRPADSRTAQALAHPLPAARLHTNICYLGGPPVPAEVLSLRALNRALLSRQLLLDRSVLPDDADGRRAAVIGTVEHLVGLQAQAPFPPYYGLWSRLAGFRPEDLAALITDRSVVRIALMRGTIHLVSARDCLPLRRQLQPVLERGLRGTFGRQLTGVDPDSLAAAGRELVEADPMTFSQLGHALAERWPDHPPAALAQGVRALVPLVQVPPRAVWGRAGQSRHTSAEHWLGQRARERAGHPENLAGLVTRYLAAFGPATAQDVAAWSGLTGLRPVLEELRPTLITFADEQGAELFDLPSAPRPDGDVPVPVRLVAEFDNLVLSHADRARVVSAENLKRFYTVNGIFPGSVLIDGFVAGLWRLARTKGAAALTIELFAPGQDLDPVVDEAERMLAFCAPGASHDVRFGPTA